MNNEKEILLRALRNSGLEDKCKKIFELWPNLEKIALRVCRYVTPYIDHGGFNLLNEVIAKAVIAYQSSPVSDSKAGATQFIRTFEEQVKVLCGLRISVLNIEDDWEIWNYDQPLLDLMHKYGRKAVQIRVREHPVEPDAVSVKFLSYICTVQDLRMAKIKLGYQPESLISNVKL